MTCPDCNGTGEYQGLTEVSACSGCGGRGRVTTATEVVEVVDELKRMEGIEWLNDQSPLIQDKQWNVPDPMAFNQEYWPTVGYFREQEEIIRSVEENKITVVPACKKVGKDFAAGGICASSMIRFCDAGYVTRIITTSNTDDHLRVLWAEINAMVSRCKYPLRVEDGGPFRMFHREVRWQWPRDHVRRFDNPRDRERLMMVQEMSYLVGMVAEKEEKMAGHHVGDGFGLGVGDESSALQDWVLTAFNGWCSRMLFFGNPNPCDNFFKRLCKGGDKG